jgi:hypothetical protein
MSYVPSDVYAWHKRHHPEQFPYLHGPEPTGHTSMWRHLLRRLRMD